MSLRRVENSSENLLMSLFNHGYQTFNLKYLKKFIKVNKSKIIVSNNSYSKTYNNFKNILPICVGKASVDMGNTALFFLRILRTKYLRV